jgi:5-dehydro-2-deoxygluconokinase
LTKIRWRPSSTIYDLGIRPDWWKLEPHASPAAWQHIDAVIAGRDPAGRGGGVLGLDADEAALAAAFRSFVALWRHGRRVLPGR